MDTPAAAASRRSRSSPHARLPDSWARQPAAAASSRAPAEHPGAAAGSGCAPYPAASSRTPAATASPPLGGQPGAARSLSSLHLIVVVLPKPQRSGCGSSSLHFLLVNTRAAALVRLRSISEFIYGTLDIQLLRWQLQSILGISKKMSMEALNMLVTQTEGWRLTLDEERMSCSTELLRCSFPFSFAVPEPGHLALLSSTDLLHAVPCRPMLHHHRCRPPSHGLSAIVLPRRHRAPPSLSPTTAQGALFAEAFLPILTAADFLRTSAKPHKSWRKLLYRLDAATFVAVRPLVVQISADILIDRPTKCWLC
uniref:Uncharacterized protein n=1 Tax=Oryza punctata TaxID=4537 RepID=A0A0E0KMU1_ORYPU